MTQIERDEKDQVSFCRLSVSLSISSFVPLFLLLDKTGNLDFRESLRGFFMDVLVKDRMGRCLLFRAQKTFYHVYP